MKNILLASLLVVTVFAASAAERARLANEKMIFSGDTEAIKGSSIFDGQKGLLKVSPDGRKLLFYREEPGKLNGLNGVARMVLRDLTDGSETLLPFPALPARLVNYLPMLAFANNPFDKTGSKIVLGVGIDADKNGTFDARTEKMQAVVFDVTTSETKNLAVTGTFVTAGYNSEGNRYIVSTYDQGEPAKIRLLLSRTDPVRWQEHVLSGSPRAISPNIDRIMLLKTAELKFGRRSREFPSDWVLYDTGKRKEAVTLPASKIQGALSMYTLVFVPRWTTLGGHLHYIDVLGLPNAPRHGTRIWERRSQTVVKDLPNVVPIGPGPTRTSMVLMRVNEVKESGSRVIGIVVHDASSNQTWEIPLPDTRILGTHDRRVIYTRKDKAGKEAVYMTEIVLP